MKKHLAIFKGRGGELILTGAKTIECRFSQKRMAPFGMVSRGDRVYIKPAGKEVRGQFIVKSVIYYDGLDPEAIDEIKSHYGKQVAVGGDFWLSHSNAKYGTLIFIGQTTRFLTAPIQIPKKDGRAWVVLD